MLTFSFHLIEKQMINKMNSLTTVTKLLLCINSSFGKSDHKQLDIIIHKQQIRRCYIVENFEIPSSFFIPFDNSSICSSVYGNLMKEIQTKVNTMFTTSFIKNLSELCQCF